MTSKCLNIDYYFLRSDGDSYVSTNHALRANQTGLVQIIFRQSVQIEYIAQIILYFSFYFS